MMTSFGLIFMPLFLILIIQFTAAAGQQQAFFTVKVGDEVTLPCGNGTQEKDNCDRIEWEFDHPGSKNVSFFRRGIFTEEAKAKSGRLNVTANCSLVIKNVTANDFGHYYCRRKTTDQKVPLIKVDLNVVTLTEQKNNEKVSFNCSVSTFTACKHTVVWLYEGKKKISPDKNTSSSCSAALTIPSSQLNSKFYELLKCKLTDVYDRKDQLFTFSHQAAAGQQRAFFTVKVGDEVTLPCANGGQEKDNSDRIEWEFDHPGSKTVSLFRRGIFTEEAKAKSGRLSVTGNCSLVIKNVTADDFGHYYCRRKTTDQKLSLIKVDLNVVTMTEQKNNEEVTFNCSVLASPVCKHKVVWLYEGKNKTSPDKNTPTSCSAVLTIPSSQLNHSKFYELLKCKATNSYDRKDQLFTFRHQSSGEKTGNNTTTGFINTNESTSTEESTLAAVTKSQRTESVFSSNSAFPTSVTPTTTRLTKMSRTKSRGWIWWTSMFSVVLAGLIITVIVTIRLRKTKGNTREPEERVEVDPVKNVYTYITFSKKSKKKKSKPAAPVPNTVIYSTLQPFSPAESPYSTVF